MKIKEMLSQAMKSIRMTAGQSESLNALTSEAFIQDDSVTI